MSKADKKTTRNRKHKKKVYLRGEVFFADLGEGIGSEQRGERPVVIVQNDVGNKYSPTVIVAPVTTRIRGKSKLPTHYYLNTGHGLEEPSTVLLEQIRTIDKQRLDNRVGKLSDKQMKVIDRKLAVSVGLNVDGPQKVILSLCSVCAKRLHASGVFSVKPIDKNAPKKNTCACCKQYSGCEHYVVLHQNHSFEEK